MPVLHSGLLGSRPSLPCPLVKASSSLVTSGAQINDEKWKEWQLCSPKSMRTTKAWGASLATPSRSEFRSFPTRVDQDSAKSGLRDTGVAFHPSSFTKKYHWFWLSCLTNPNLPQDSIRKKRQLDCSESKDSRNPACDK